MRITPILLAATLLLAPAVAADDPDPPEFKGLSLEPGPYGPGDLVPLQLRWEDASGIDQVHASALGPADLRIHWVECEDPQDHRVAVVDCRLHLPARAPGGTYRIDHVQAQDVVGHYASVQTLATFQVVSPYDDRTGPALTGLQQDLTTLDMAAHAADGGQVRVPEAFFLKASDDSNISYAGIDFEGPNRNSGMWGQCERQDAAGRLFVCAVHADAEIPAGAYVVRGVHVQDEIGYQSHYHYDGAIGGPFRDLRSVQPTQQRVQVLTPHVDDDAPLLTALTFPGRLHRGQPFEVRINATDATAVEDVYVHFRTTRGNAGYSVTAHASCQGELDTDMQLVCTGRFPDNFPLGLALVDWVHVSDAGRNHGWLRPIEVGNEGGPPETQFRDDDAHDVGTVLVPRPIEGVLEAVDAVVNEVLPGEVATIVYQAKDTVDDVELVLQDAVDGSQVTVDCAEAVTTLLGQECDFTVPAGEDGVLSLVSATVQTASGQQTSTYEAGQVPLLAVSREIPKAAAAPLAVGGGALNTVGSDWYSEFEKAKQLAAQGAELGPTSSPPGPPAGMGDSTMNVTASESPVRGYVTSDRTFTATPRFEDEVAEPEGDVPPIRFEPGDGGDDGPMDLPLPTVVVPAALALALAAWRRRVA